MIVTHNEQVLDDDLNLGLDGNASHQDETGRSIIPTSFADTSQLLLPGRTFIHHPKAGLNPLVDVAGNLFTLLGKLKQLTSCRQPSKLHKELLQEINAFYDAIKTHSYNSEYIVVCRYVVCATIDDIISNTPWGGQGLWDTYSLLAAYNQDTSHQEKFFTILERALQEPAHYIDLMELMYICLSMGYKGSYRRTEHSQYQLEQITNSLYKHIRAYRGSFSKTLSPTPLKFSRMTIRKVFSLKYSLLIILGVTACVVMTIFIGLGYLMDVISNEAYKNITQIQSPASRQT